MLNFKFILTFVN